SPVAVQEAWAVCSPDPYPGGGQVTVACGSGDYNNGIRYDDATTSTGTSSIFGFMNSQVLGPTSGFDRSAVVISSNEVGHTIDINIMQEDGAEPSFTGRNWTNNA